MTGQKLMALMRARATARYKLRQVHGKPEELELVAEPSIPSAYGNRLPTPQRQGVSFGYGCGQIRVRLMVGRTWLASADFDISKPMDWRRFYEILDPHFGWTPPGNQANHQPLDTSDRWDLRGITT